MGPKNHLLQVLLCFYIVGLHRHVESLENIDLNSDETLRFLTYKVDEKFDTYASWKVTGPDGRRLLLLCSPISLPKSANCTRGKLTISDGERNPKKSQVCSETSYFRKVSTEPVMVVELWLRRNYDGWVKCKVRLFRTDLQGPPEPDLNQPLQTSCPCGRRNENHIVRPQEAGIEEFVYAVHLKLRGTEKVICGGSILTERHILTAASCVLTPEEKERKGLRVVVGHNLAKDGENSGLVFKVHKIHVHEGYNPQNIPSSNIGLLELKENIEFNDRLRPVCLPRVAYHLDKMRLSTLGWSVPRRSTLQKVEVIVDDSESCVDPQHRGRYVQPRPIEHCTRPQDQETCKEEKSGPPASCKLDTGTPLLHWDPQLLRYVQVGFHVNKGDASNPGITIEVFRYYDWIQRKIELAGQPGTLLERVITFSKEVGLRQEKREKSPVYTCEQLEQFMLPQD